MIATHPFSPGFVGDRVSTQTPQPPAQERDEKTSASHGPSRSWSKVYGEWKSSGWSGRQVIWAIRCPWTEAIWYSFAAW